MGLPSVIGPVEADEHRIDLVAFKAFANALLAWHTRTGHTVMTALSEGFVATVPALAERAGIEVAWQSAECPESGRLRDVQFPTAAAAHQLQQPAELRQKSRELARSMPD